MCTHTHTHTYIHTLPPNTPAAFIQNRCTAIIGGNILKLCSLKKAKYKSHEEGSEVTEIGECQREICAEHIKKGII